MNGMQSKLKAMTRMILALAMLLALCMAASGQETANDWVNKGLDLFNDQSFQEALEAFEKAIEIDPQNDTILGLLSTTHDILRVQESTKGLSIAEKKLEKNPQNALAWQSRGGFLAQLDMTQEANKSFEKAVDIYDQEIQKNPNNGTVWWYKAENLANLQQFEDALDAYEKVIELNHPRKVDALSTKGSILMQFGRLNESLNALDNALELNPKHTLSWMLKSRLLKEMGQDAESDAAFAKARALGYKGEPLPSFI